MPRTLPAQIYQQKLMGDSLWELASRYFVCAGVGGASKLFVECMYDFRAEDSERLITAVEERPADRPLVTVCNHTSTLDEPCLWALLPHRVFRNLEQMRWTIAAEDVCFAGPLSKWFFGSGHGISVRRGAGLQQPGVELAVRKLLEGKWLHIFPEGKVYQNRQVNFMRWGVAKCVATAYVRSPHRKAAMVLPFYHSGMELVVPLSRFDTTVGYPTICWPGSLPIRVAVGEPFYVDGLIDDFLNRHGKARIEDNFRDDTDVEKQFYSALTEHIAERLRQVERHVESQRVIE